MKPRLHHGDPAMQGVSDVEPHQVSVEDVGAPNVAQPSRGKPASFPFQAAAEIDEGWQGFTC